jgi:hypothetical protein
MVQTMLLLSCFVVININKKYFTGFGCSGDNAEYPHLRFQVPLQSQQPDICGAVKQ